MPHIFLTIFRTHRKPIAAEVAALGIGIPGFVFSITHTADHLKDIAELIAPQGRLALINNEPLDLASLMRKSVSIHWESMFTRSLMETADMAEQHALLEQVAALRLSRLCPPCAAPSSSSSLAHRRSDARIVAN